MAVAIYSGAFSIRLALLVSFVLQLLFIVHPARSASSNPVSMSMLQASAVPSKPEDHQHLQDCQHCNGHEEDEGSFEEIKHRPEGVDQHSTFEDQGVSPNMQMEFNYQQLQQRSEGAKAGSLTQVERELQYITSLINRTQVNPIIREKYSIWRREYDNPHSDSILKLMKDQIIVAKVYLSIAHPMRHKKLAFELAKHIKESERVIGEANSDAELDRSAIEQAKAVGYTLVLAKSVLHDCAKVVRKLRSMILASEENIHAQKRKRDFLHQLASKQVPKPLTCLVVRLMIDYFMSDDNALKELPDGDKLHDNNLYHYAIFSDNILATSVVVNSAVAHALDPKKLVFHIVTDRLNFAAMKMWFFAHPTDATVHVEKIDDFKWLTPSYSPVLRQLEKMKANYSDARKDPNYRNPKYLSMLSHLMFYLPELYPKLKKILFLDDDVVVQKDLSWLWLLDMEGMVNGAVETCKGRYHQLRAYLDFSNPIIFENFEPEACILGFGMNIFDLDEWKKQNITGQYHHWHNLAKDQNLWKLGSLPSGLLTFYNSTYHLERTSHLLDLGYDPTLSDKEIEETAVIHYNGNYKPWLDLAIPKYKHYWSKYVDFDNEHLQSCNIRP